MEIKIIIKMNKIHNKITKAKIKKKTKNIKNLIIVISTIIVCRWCFGDADYMDSLHASTH